jgi:hypothetical protein
MRPALAIGIANIASHWSSLEHTLSLPFTTLLAGREESAFEAYHEIFETSLRHKMFVAAAKRKKLTKELIQESEELQKLVRKAAKQRNAVVHGIWAYIDEDEECLLLSPPDAMNRKIDEFFSQMYDVTDDLEKGKIDTWSFNMCPVDFTKYTFQDLNDIVERIIEINSKALEFWQKVNHFSLKV